MNNASTPGDNQRRGPGQNRDGARTPRNAPRQNRDGPPANQENQEQYEDAPPPRPYRATYRASRDNPGPHQVAPRGFRDAHRVNRAAQDQNRDLADQRRVTLGHRRGVPANQDPIQGPPDNRVMEPMFTMPFPFQTESDGEALCPPRPGIPARPGVLSTRRSRVLTSEETFFSMVRSNHLNVNNPTSYPETSDRADDRRLEFPSTSRVTSDGRASLSIPSIMEDDPTVLDRMIESFDKQTLRCTLGSSLCKIKSGNNRWDFDASASSSTLDSRAQLQRSNAREQERKSRNSQDNCSEFSAASTSGITIAESSSEDVRPTRQSKADKDNEDESENPPDSASNDRDDVSTSSNAVDGSCNTGGNDVYSYVQAQVVNYVYSNPFDASSNAALGADASLARDSSVLGLPARNRGRRANMRNARFSNSGPENVQYAECYLEDDILDW